MASQLSRCRPGFTLIEVIVALVLLAAVGLTLGAATARVASANALDAQALAALDLVNDRLARIQADPSYPDLVSRYAETDAVLPGFTGMTRTTTVVRQVENTQDGRQLDITHVNVAVAAPGLARPVERSASVAAP